jgi:hypothetical protein
MKTWMAALALVAMSLVTVGLLAVTDSYIEVNSLTGATRSRVRYGRFISTAWKCETTWMDQAAKRQGIPTDKAWQQLSHTSRRPLVKSIGCSRAPVAYHLRVFGTNGPPWMSRPEVDRFVVEFAVATEPERLELVDALQNQDDRPTKP